MLFLIKFFSNILLIFLLLFLIIDFTKRNIKIFNDDYQNLTFKNNTIKIVISSLGIIILLLLESIYNVNLYNNFSFELLKEYFQFDYLGQATLKIIFLSTLLIFSKLNNIKYLHFICALLILFYFSLKSHIAVHYNYGFILQMIHLFFASLWGFCIYFTKKLNEVKQIKIISILAITSFIILFITGIVNYIIITNLENLLNYYSIILYIKISCILMMLLFAFYFRKNKNRKFLKLEFKTWLFIIFLTSLFIYFPPY